MKKIINLFAIITIISSLIFINKVYAATLDTLKVETNKTIVKPGEEVKTTITFGQALGSYTFNFSYDNNILEYVSVDGGTANDTTDKVKVTFFDTTGGSNARSNMSIIFKAKSNITTSNPTEITVTGEGLANADASVTYDDITIPIVKNITVEPEYVDYTFKLTYTGEIIKNKAKDMVLSYSSPMGRGYEHARLTAEATTPNGGNVTLIGTDNSSLEHDIIQSGWGDAQGYKIGGKDVSQVLNVQGTFSEAGNYTITLRLIDRDNSDAIIAEQDFKFTVLSEEVQTPPTSPEETIKPEETPKQPEKNEQPNTQNKVEKPSQLPKTGINIYIPIVVILFSAIILILIVRNENKK